MHPALPAFAVSRPSFAVAATAAHEVARPLQAVASHTTTTTASTPIFIIPNGTIIPELVLFIIVLGVMAKFILPPINKAMAERDHSIKSALSASDEGRTESTRLARERAEVLEGARAEARAILEEAARAAQAAVDAGRAAGQAEYDRLLAQAAPGIAADADRVRSELTDRLDELVLAAAGRIVGAPVDAARHAGVLGETAAAARGENGV